MLEVQRVPALRTLRPASIPWGSQCWGETSGVRPLAHAVSEEGTKGPFTDLEALPISIAKRLRC